MIDKVRGSEQLPQAGELLAVEAIDRTGLIVTSEGTFVRITRVKPANPLLMSEEERDKTATTFQRLIGQLRDRETLQFLIQATPVNLEELLAEVRREVQLCAGPPPASDQQHPDPVSLSRWRLYAWLEESLRLHADEQAAVRVDSYMVVPYLPAQHVARAALAYARARGLATAPLQRTVAAHRRAVREQLAHVDALRAELEAEGMSTELLDGEQTVELLWSCFNPTHADRHNARRITAGEVLGEFDAPVERETARRAALGLRELIARSAIDFDRDAHVAHVDRDAEQTILVATTAGRTGMGWLHGAMLTRQPFTLSVFVHGLERRRERQRLKARYRRVFAVNRGQEQHGRVPDFDRLLQEQEYEQQLAEMASGPQASFFRVSIYQKLRARGPDPNLEALSEAVDFCSEQLESVGDCKVGKGTFRQRELWQSTLPLGRDVLQEAHKYPTVNAADMVPLVGTRCGSPTGIPFAFAQPGRTVEQLNPYDEEHLNHTIVIAGRSGSGKTMTANVVLARTLAMGARAFVIDRAGHYETLTRLVHGAQHIDIGSDASSYALNPWDLPDPSRVSREKTAFLLALHQVMMGHLDARELGLMGAAIRAVYAKAAALGLQPRESMLQQELRSQAQEAQRADAAEVAATLRNLADRLSEYCDEGTYAYLLDRETTVPLDSPLVVFDTRRCPESQLQVVMFAIMEYVVATVERHWDALRDRASAPDAPLFLGRSILLGDEFWKFVSDEQTGEYTNDLAHRARHLGLALIVMSQQLSEFATKHGTALLANSSQQLLLAQNPLEIPFIANTLELSARETTELGRLRTVRGRYAQMLWLNGSRGRGKVTMRLGPSEYWAFTSNPTDVALRDQQTAVHDGKLIAAIQALARHGTQIRHLARAA